MPLAELEAAKKPKPPTPEPAADDEDDEDEKGAYAPSKLLAVR
jgi:hypothetical protein